MRKLTFGFCSLLLAASAIAGSPVRNPVTEVDPNLGNWSLHSAVSDITTVSTNFDIGTSNQPFGVVYARDFDAIGSTFRINNRVILDVQTNSQEMIFHGSSGSIIKRVDDTGQLTISAGSGFVAAKGGKIVLSGVDNSSSGLVQVVAGNTEGGEIQFLTRGGSSIRAILDDAGNWDFWTNLLQNAVITNSTGYFTTNDLPLIPWSTLGATSDVNKAYVDAADLGVATNATNHANSVGLSTGTASTNYANSVGTSTGTASTNYANSVGTSTGTASTNYANSVGTATGTASTNYANSVGTSTGTASTNYANSVGTSTGTASSNYTDTAVADKVSTNDITDLPTSGQGVIWFKPTETNTTLVPVLVTASALSSNANAVGITANAGQTNALVITFNTNVVSQADVDTSVQNATNGVMDTVTNLGYLTASATNNMVRDNTANTYSGGTTKTQDFTGVKIVVPTPLDGPDAATRAFVLAQVAAAGATNAIYGELYQFDASNSLSLAIADTYYQITNWTVGDILGMTATTSNLTVNADGEYDLKASISFSGTANRTIEVATFVNGVEQQQGVFKRRLGTGGDVGVGVVVPIKALNIADVVDIRAKCLANTATIVIEEACFTMIRIVSSSGGTNWAQWAAAQDVNAGGNIITNYGTPTAADHVVDKGWVDGQNFLTANTWWTNAPDSEITAPTNSATVQAGIVNLLGTEDGTNLTFVTSTNLTDATGFLRNDGNGNLSYTKVHHYGEIMRTNSTAALTKDVWQVVTNCSSGPLNGITATSTSLVTAVAGDYKVTVNIGGTGDKDASWEIRPVTAAGAQRAIACANTPADNDYTGSSQTIILTLAASADVWIEIRYEGGDATETFTYLNTGLVMELLR